MTRTKARICRRAPNRIETGYEERLGVDTDDASVLIGGNASSTME